VKEEEDGMFPKARKSDLDLGVVGRTMAARKEALMEDLEMSGADVPPPPRAKATNGSKRASKSGM
jgi:hypothetical protein